MGILDWLRQISLRGIVENIVASFIWAVIGGFFVLIIGLYRNDRTKFAGRWDAVIHWEPEWAKYLFGSTEEVTDPKSEGLISLSYGSGQKKSQYWGLGYYELKSGDKLYARIALQIYDVITTRPFFQSESPYIKALRIDSFSVKPLVRKAEIDFKYGPSQSYFIEVEISTTDRIEGVMKRRIYKESKEVGRFIASRVL